MAESGTPIQIGIERQDEASMLVAEGVLDSFTYRDLRDTVIKAALDEPRAVIVDVSRLSVMSASAWSVFTSARWYVSTWPDVPILLVCTNYASRREITAHGMARYVPVYETRELALEAVRSQSLHVRRRARARLPASTASLRIGRAQIAYWLNAWDKSPLIPVAGVVATVFIENVLKHTASAPVLIVESYESTITVAVEDDSHQPATRHEDPRRGAEVLSGLSIVSALCRIWGSTPTPSGKTVWASIGSENQL